MFLNVGKALGFFYFSSLQLQITKVKNMRTDAGVCSSGELWHTLKHWAVVRSHRSSSVTQLKRHLQSYVAPSERVRYSKMIDLKAFKRIVDDRRKSQKPLNRMVLLAGSDPKTEEDFF